MIQQILNRIAEAVIPLDENQSESERKAVIKYAQKVTSFKENLEQEVQNKHLIQKRFLVLGAISMLLGAIGLSIANVYLGVGFFLPHFAWIGITVFFLVSMIKLATSNPSKKILRFWQAEKDKLDTKLMLIRNGDNRNSWEKGLEKIVEDWDEMSGQFKKIAKEHKNNRKRMRRMR